MINILSYKISFNGNTNQLESEKFYNNPSGSSSVINLNEQLEDRSNDPNNNGKALFNISSQNAVKQRINLAEERYNYNSKQQSYNLNQLPSSIPSLSQGTNFEYQSNMGVNYNYVYKKCKPAVKSLSSRNNDPTAELSKIKYKSSRNNSLDRSRGKPNFSKQARNFTRASSINSSSTLTNQHIQESSVRKPFGNTSFHTLTIDSQGKNRSTTLSPKVASIYDFKDVSNKKVSSKITSMLELQKRREEEKVRILNSLLQADNFNKNTQKYSDKETNTASKIIGSKFGKHAVKRILNTQSYVYKETLSESNMNFQRKADKMRGEQNIPDEVFKRLNDNQVDFNQNISTSLSALDKVYDPTNQPSIHAEVQFPKIVNNNTFSKLNIGEKAIRRMKIELLKVSIKDPSDTEKRSSGNSRNASFPEKLLKGLKSLSLGAEILNTGEVHPVNICLEVVNTNPKLNFLTSSVAKNQTLNFSQDDIISQITSNTVNPTKKTLQPESSVTNVNNASVNFDGSKVINNNFYGEIKINPTQPSKVNNLNLSVNSEVNVTQNYSSLKTLIHATGEREESLKICFLFKPTLLKINIEQRNVIEARAYLIMVPSKLAEGTGIEHYHLVIKDLSFNEVYKIDILQITEAKIINNDSFYIHFFDENSKERLNIEVETKNISTTTNYVSGLNFLINSVKTSIKSIQQRQSSALNLFNSSSLIGLKDFKLKSSVAKGYKEKYKSSVLLK